MSIKILLADDSITIQKVVGIIFGGEEYSLTVVDNGKAAVEKARDINPDVLLIDALMPGMSGYEVCEAVRATPSIASKPILLLTGSFEPFDEDKARTCGADDFLSKPFESQQIVTKVKELFELGASRSGAPVAAAAVSEPEDLVPPLVPDVAAEPAEAGDIWGAFTAAEETAAIEPEALEPAPAETAAAEEIDVFATVGAEFDEPAAETTVIEEGTGSQWIPVEEETFAFEEPEAAAPAAVTAASIEESMFGDTDFGAAAAEPAVPVVETTPEFESDIELETEPVAEPAVEPVVEPVIETAAEPVAAPAAAAVATAALTEDQLREALTAASKDVIERIVWEVVPDLAEVLIKEAIRRIKEGK